MLLFQSKLKLEQEAFQQCTALSTMLYDPLMQSHFLGLRLSSEL
jgi:hypothetical protein